MVGDEVVQIGGDRQPLLAPDVGDRDGPAVVLRTQGGSPATIPTRIRPTRT
ncbi:hypothetical protein [Streptomyces cellulosae]|uniref:hypothetical protein n=1 Tax=Streptomyces cellulosae TaxID=1968 RepID=UPI002D21BC3E|nr:hypothetical protein [Streptomyces cellulosae]